jgi:hypothetical protein
MLNLNWLRFLIVSLLFLYSILAWTNPFPLTWGDTWIYLSLAGELKTRLTFQYFNLFTVPVPPAYPIWIAPAIFLTSNFESSLVWIGVFNSIGIIAILPLMILAGRQLNIPPSHALIGWLPLGLAAYATQYVQDVMSENIAIALNLVFFSSLIGRHSSVRGLFIGVSGALCILTKPLCLLPVFLGIFTGLLVDILEIRREHSTTGSRMQLQPIIRTYAAAILLPLLTILGWLNSAGSLAVFTGELAGSYRLESLSPTVVGFIEAPQKLLILLYRLSTLAAYTILALCFLPLLLVTRVDLRQLPGKAMLVCFAIWLGYAGSSALFQEIYFLPDTPSYLFYGRYVDCALPLIAIVSVSQLSTVQSTRLKAILIGAGLLIAGFFPIDQALGLRSIAVSGWYYLNKLSDTGLLYLPLAGISAALMLWPRLRPFYLATVVVLGVYGAVMEDLRVRPFKQSWKNSVTTNWAFRRSPPEKTEILLIDTRLKNKKLVWYWMTMYLHSQKGVLGSVPPPPDKTVLAITASNESVPGFRRCSRPNEFPYAWCKRPR